ncbi:MAG: hypothetical protein KGV59_03100 [Tenacibaculum sp.]|nr:hypothetical protein [Tenacibaculum sp.]
MDLGLTNPTNLDEVDLPLILDSEVEVSIYVGCAHNPCDIKNFEIKRIKGNIYEINCSLFIDFEHEMVAKNEEFNFKTEIELNTTIKE